MRSHDPKDGVSHSSSGALPLSDANRSQIREQLKRLLADRLFQHSKRYGSMLQYIVQHALEGKPDHVKERTIGLEVFGRDPDYDTNSDPVVRVTATELRKRIAQYYVDPKHAAELRIDMPAGSYVPEFRLPTPSPVAAKGNLALRLWPLYLLVAVLVAGLSLWLKPREANTTLDWFWRPVLNSHGDVLICVAPPRPASAYSKDTEQAVTLRDLHFLGTEDVAISDLITVSKIAGYLTLHGKPYDIRNYRSANLADLRERPSVIVGGFNNEWAIRLLGELRFSYQQDENRGLLWIQDKQDTAQRNWCIDLNLPYKELKEDYAIISRVLHPTTEQMFVSVSGITKIGTIAAGEFLISESNMQLLFQEFPQARQSRNLQVVLATKVIQGNSGPSRIVASAFW